MEGVPNPEQLYSTTRDIIDAREIFEREAIEAEAWKLIHNRDKFPEVGVEHKERQDNARTALIEALTASGHLSRVEIEGSLDEINAQVLSRLLNGWDDSLPWHEKQRRFAELCEELVIQKTHGLIAAGLLPQDTAIGMISDHPVAMEESLAVSLGYRRKNNKGMVRTTHLAERGNGVYSRVIEQVSRSSGTWVSTFRFFQQYNIETPQGEPDIAALQSPFLYDTNQFADGVVDIIRQLDVYGGQGALYGDITKLDKHVTYEQLRAESERREKQIEIYTNRLAGLEAQLDALVDNGTITSQERLQTFSEQVDRILSAICTLDPDYAEDTFGERAAPYFHEAALQAAAGNYEMAQLIVNNAHELKETITFCGMAISLEKAKELGLPVDSYQDLVENGKENWGWKIGVCIVPKCPTRPSKTKVGPCNVCEKCQDLYDHNKDPVKLYASTALFGITAHKQEAKAAA